MCRRYRRPGRLSGRDRWQDRVVDRRAAQRGAAAWAASGAMVLTGRSAGPPLGAPPALIELIDRAVAVLSPQQRGGYASRRLALLGERAALSGLTRGGAVSCGGGARLVPSLDGWLAVSLARPEDVAALPGLVGPRRHGGRSLGDVGEVAAATPAAALDAQAALLGLPIAAVGSVGPCRAAGPSTCPWAPCGSGVTAGLPVRSDRRRSSTSPHCGPGPSVRQLLAEAGARVDQGGVDGRPDGARRGPAQFFDLLNGAKQSVALDLASAAGRRDLARLICRGRRGDRERAAAGTRADGHRQQRRPRPAATGLWSGRRSRATGATPDTASGWGSATWPPPPEDSSPATPMGPCFLADAVADPADRPGDRRCRPRGARCRGSVAHRRRHGAHGRSGRRAPDRRRRPGGAPAPCPRNGPRRSSAWALTRLPCWATWPREA